MRTLFVLLLLTTSAYADTFNACLRVEEEDESPSNIDCRPLRVPNGSLTDNADYFSLAITNAATATALAANGANCSAGSYPLGVDASGASESCTAAQALVEGTNGIDISGSTINFDATEVTDATFGTAGGPITWTFNTGSTGDPSLRFTDDGMSIHHPSATRGFQLLVTQASITAEDSVAGTATHEKMISVQGDGGAYFMGRDVTNNIEFIMGTSTLGAAFAGAMTAHDFQLRTDNTTRVTIAKTTGNATFVGTIISSATSSLGWSNRASANQACNTTCTSACVDGYDNDAANFAAYRVGCASAAADTCLCAGAS